MIKNPGMKVFRIHEMYTRWVSPGLLLSNNLFVLFLLLSLCTQFYFSSPSLTISWYRQKENSPTFQSIPQSRPPYSNLQSNSNYHQSIPSPSHQPSCDIGIKLPLNTVNCSLLHFPHINRFGSKLRLDKRKSHKITKNLISQPQIPPLAIIELYLFLPILS